MIGDEVTVRRFGLQLPNGATAWNNYRGHDLDTPDGRTKLVEVLRQTAVNLDFPEALLLMHYKWVTRIETASDSFPITSPLALDPEETGDGSGDEGNASDGDAGAVRGGLLGSTS